MDTKRAFKGMHMSSVNSELSSVIIGRHLGELQFCPISIQGQTQPFYFCPLDFVAVSASLYIPLRSVATILFEFLGSDAST